jgi:hypothetical protein
LIFAACRDDSLARAVERGDAMNKGKVRVKAKGE